MRISPESSSLQFRPGVCRGAREAGGERGGGGAALGMPTVPARSWGVPEREGPGLGAGGGHPAAGGGGGQPGGRADRGCIPEGLLPGATHIPLSAGVLYLSCTSLAT